MPAPVGHLPRQGGLRVGSGPHGCCSRQVLQVLRWGLAAPGSKLVRAVGGHSLLARRQRSACLGSRPPMSPVFAGWSPSRPSPRLLGLPTRWLRWPSRGRRWGVLTVEQPCQKHLVYKLAWPPASSGALQAPQTPPAPTATASWLSVAPDLDLDRSDREGGAISQPAGLLLSARHEPA